MKKQKTIEIYKKYLEIFPEDLGKLEILDKQIQNQNEDLFDRKNFTGHVVANALIIHNDKVLTIFHNKLKMYLQPGGHVDLEDESVFSATLREVKEETGIKDLALLKWYKDENLPILIESHLISKNKKKNEEEHWHHDFMYVFMTDKNDVELQLEEVSDFEWVDMDKVLKENSESFIGKSLLRLKELKII